MLHHAMHERGLPTTIAPQVYCAAISQCDGDANVKAQLEIVGRLLRSRSKGGNDRTCLGMSAAQPRFSTRSTECLGS